MNISQEIRKLDDENKAKVFDFLGLLFVQFLPSSGMNEPHFLFIDNTILQDIKKRDESCRRKNRFLAVSLFARFLKESGLNINLVLPPAILYELNGRNTIESEDQYKKLLIDGLDYLGIFDMKVYPVGYKSYKDLKKLFLYIRHDEAQIKKAINKIKAKDWSVKLKDENRIFFPSYFARKIMPARIRLKYFYKGYVEWMLASLAERLILENRNNDKYARKNFRHDMIFSLASLSKIEGDILKGLGDIELLQYCDISSQFRNEELHTSTAITFDKRLMETLAHRTTLGFSSSQIQGGASDVEIQSFMDEIFTGNERLNAVTKKEQLVRDKSWKYFNELLVDVF